MSLRVFTGLIVYAGKFVVGIHKIVNTKCLVEPEDTADF